MQNAGFGRQPKMDKAVRHYAQSKGIVIPPGRKSHIGVLLDLYNNPQSEIYRGLKLAPLPLTDAKYNRRYKDRGLTRGDAPARKEAYTAYINSSAWVSLRNQIKIQRGNKCERCGAAGVELHGHHLTYERLFNESPEDIQILCRGCHRLAHQKPKRKKTLAEKARG